MPIAPSWWTAGAAPASRASASASSTCGSTPGAAGGELVEPHEHHGPHPFDGLPLARSAGVAAQQPQAVVEVVGGHHLDAVRADPGGAAVDRADRRRCAPRDRSSRRRGPARRDAGGSAAGCARPSTTSTRRRCRPSTTTGSRRSSVPTGSVCPTSRQQSRNSHGRRLSSVGSVSLARHGAREVGRRRRWRLTRVIEFLSVTKSYPDGTVAVDALDLTIDAGKVTVFVGPSGCGKTTSLRMINRMIEPTVGHDHRRRAGHPARPIRPICAAASATSSRTRACSRTARSWTTSRRSRCCWAGRRRRPARVPSS